MNKFVPENQIGRKTASFFTDVFLCVLYCACFSYAILEQFFAAPNIVSLFLWTFLLVLVWMLITHNGVTIGVFMITLGVLLLPLIPYLLETRAASWANIIDMVIDTSAEWNQQQRVYEQLLIVVVAFFIAPIAVSLIRKADNFLVPCLLGLIVYMVQWVMGFTGNYVMFLLFFAVIALLYLKRANFRMYRKIKAEKPVKLYTAAAFPLCILAVIIAFFGTAGTGDISEEALEKDYVKMTASFAELEDYFNELIVTEYFDFSQTGFSQRDGVLGGNVRPNNTTALLLKSSKPLLKPLFLAGAYKDTYDGKSWKNTITEMPSMAVDRTQQIETERSAFLELSKRTLYIKHIVAQKLLFVPQNIAEVKLPNREFSVNAAGEYIAQVPVSNRYQYDIQYYDITVSKDGLPPEGYYNKLYGEALSKGERGKEDAALYEQLNAHSKWVDMCYRELPDSLPQRVKDLAAEITADCEQNNRYEKAKAIEKYLTDNYEYTKEPGDVPAGVDFVDYFLFENKEGYCTYYASAMTILCRAAGIPARYAEGYAVPEIPDSGETYKVKNETAHAWTEIYVEGAGWLQLDPTATIIFPVTIIIEETEDSNHLIPPPGDGGMAGGGTQQDDPPPNIIEDEPTPDILGLQLLYIAFAIVFVLLIGAFILLCYMKEKGRIRRLEGLPAGKKYIRRCYKEILRLMKVNEIKINPSETATQLGIRLDADYMIDGVGFDQISELFTRYAYADQSEYGDKHVDSGKLRAFYDGLYKKVKADLGITWFYGIYIKAFIRG